MKTNIITAFVFLSSWTFAATLPPTLSENSKISIVTIAPYQGEIWSVFGHTGILVRDDSQHLDAFFNYGLFDFNQEDFYLNFALGKLSYRVGASSYERVVEFYKGQNRAMTEQYLNLTRSERQEVYDFLLHNIRPENASYPYNYVYNNCANKITEIITTLFPTKIHLDYSFVVPHKTIRSLMGDYLHSQTWWRFIINIFLGQQIDNEASPKEYFFLPDYVMLSLAKSSILKEGETLPLIEKTTTTEVDKDDTTLKRTFTPFNTFIILFFVFGLITHRDLKYQRRTKWVDTLFFSVSGFLGVWFIFMWAATAHLSEYNLNLLWALPPNLLFAFCISSKKWHKAAYYYFKIIAWIYIALILLWGLLPQPLSKALIPIVLILIFRSFYIVYWIKKNSTTSAIKI